MKVEDYEYNFIDEIWTFKGVWDILSKCGLKIVLKEDISIIIVTELYDDNTGSSVTDACVELANQICDEYNLQKNNILYIEHNPELNSKYNFLSETFDVVSFRIENNILTDPQWEKTTREAIEKMMA